MLEHPMVVATFDEANALCAAARRLHRAGHPARDAFVPYPVHGLEASLGLARSRLAVSTLVGGTLGALVAFGLQAWASAVSWPVEVGGKPPFSPLAFVPLTFEATILFAGLATAGAFFWRCRLRPTLVSPTPVDGVTDDRFALVIDPANGDLDETAIEELVRAAGAVGVGNRRFER